MSGDESGSFVTVLRSGNKQLVKCPCEIPSRAAPRLFIGMDPDQSAALWIRGLQAMFNDDDPDRVPPLRDHREVRPARRRTGSRCSRTTRPGKVTEPGVVDEVTWGILTDRLCRNYDY